MVAGVPLPSLTCCGAGRGGVARAAEDLRARGVLQLSRHGQGRPGPPAKWRRAGRRARGTAPCATRPYNKV